MFNGKYISAREILYRIRRNPLMNDANFFDIMSDIYDVLNLIGAPVVYESKMDTIPIVDFRIDIPNDLLYIEGVNLMDGANAVPLRNAQSKGKGSWGCLAHQGINYNATGTFHVKKNHIYFEYETGIALLEYKAIVMDDEGYPMIPDVIQLIKAIELYTKIQHLGIKVELGLFNGNILSAMQQEYAFYIAAAETHFKMPDEAEMESIRSGLIRIVSNFRSFDERREFETLPRINP
jgi:hypothetical protein